MLNQNIAGTAATPALIRRSAERAGALTTWLITSVTQSILVRVDLVGIVRFWAVVLVVYESIAVVIVDKGAQVGLLPTGVFLALGQIAWNRQSSCGIFHFYTSGGISIFFGKENNLRV